MTTLRQVTSNTAKNIPSHAVILFLADNTICSVPVKYINTELPPELQKNIQSSGQTEKLMIYIEVLCLGKYNIYSVFI